MPPYQFKVNESLKNGLKPDSRVPNGSQTLDVCDYLRPTVFGLKDFIDITQPMTDSYITSTLGETILFPHPQLFRGAGITLLCFIDAIYEVDESTWTATEITFYTAAQFDSANPAAGTITSGGAWHFVDYHSTWVLFNGVSTIWNTAHLDKPIVTSDVTINTGCDLKGRMFMGGFDPTDFYALADWPTYWEGFDSNVPEQISQALRTMSTGAGSNWAWWSTIGGGDMLWLVSLPFMTDAVNPQNMVSNGGFTGAATGWTLGTGFAYSANTIVATTATANLSQASGSLIQVLSNTVSFDVTFTVSSYSVGTLTPFIGGVSGTAVSANGTYTQTIVSASDIASLIFTGAGFTGVIDNVYVTPTDSTAYTSALPYWQDLWGRNEMGMCPLPWQGTILHQRRLGDTVICYGDGGITALVPHSSPVSTMAPMDLHGIGRDIGIASRSAVGGGKDEHVFVDASGELWKVGTDLVATRLGYGYIFADFLGNPIVISHDGQRGEYYISGYTGSVYESYVLTSTGLGKAPWVPTSVNYTDGGLVGILPGATAAGVEIITTRFGSPDRRSVDQITAVSLTTVDTDATGWSVVVEYRFNKNDSFVSAPAVVCDKRGVAVVNVSGLEFRIKCTNPDRTKCDLDAIDVDMMSGGKRNLSVLT